MRRPLTALLALPLLACSHTPSALRPDAGTDTAARARALTRRVPIADGHVDVPYRLYESRAPDGTLTEDVTARTPKGDFDHPRALEGGLTLPFMSIYVPSDKQAEKGAAKAHADLLIDMVEALVRRAPDKFALARSPAEARRNFAEGKVSLPLGIENGAAVEDSLENVAHFHQRGVRYITLTHSSDNQLSDSSFQSGTRRWGGLSPLGKQVVGEMNRLGIMVDVSHLSDDAIRQVLSLSRAPVIASHSSARHFTPGFERNLSDELIRGIAAGGGVVMVNFGSAFLTAEANAYGKAARDAVEAFGTQRGLERDHPEVAAFRERYKAEHPYPFASVKDVANHVDHIVKLVGVAHVGLGSDFDGVGDSLPTGLKDVSQYPNLFAELLARGYSEADLERIASGNLLRVWERVEAVAAGK